LIEDGIRDYRATGSMRDMPILVIPVKAEALHLAYRTFEALEAINEEALIERNPSVKPAGMSAARKINSVRRADLI
jgi:hypothetical protein